MTTLNIDLLSILPYALFIVSELIGLSPSRTTGIVDSIVKGAQSAFRKPSIQENIDVLTGDTTTPRSLV